MGPPEYTLSRSHVRQMDRSGRGADPQGFRLARSYLAMRAEQSAEPQPRQPAEAVRKSIRLPRLDRLHLSSPEAHAQVRLALLARLANTGEPWFTLARKR